MKFLADESLDYPVVKLLRENGYDVTYAAELCRHLMMIPF